MHYQVKWVDVVVAVDQLRNYEMSPNSHLLKTFLIAYFLFTAFKIMTTVLQAPVKMMEHVWMKSTTTRVLV